MNRQDARVARIATRGRGDDDQISLLGPGVFGVLAVHLLFLGGCASSGGIEHRAVAPEVKQPLVAERVTLPVGAAAAAAWIGSQGDGLIALRDGRVLAIDARGVVRPVDRIPGESARANDGAVVAFAARDRGSPLALLSSGALALQGGMLRRASLPSFLGDARAFAPLGGEALWATANGLYATRGDQWIDVQSIGGGGSLRDVVDLVPLGDGSQREAWVLRGGVVQRLRVDGAGVTWIEAAPGVELGQVRAIARVDPTRGAIASAQGVTIVAPGSIRVFEGDAKDGAPEVIGGGGGWAWVGWAGQLLRTDGDKWESLVGGVTLGASARIAVDEGAGASALVVDASGGVLRVVAEEALRASGIIDGALVLDTRIELEAIAPRPSDLESVHFVVDGKEVAARTSAPWGWANDGGRVRDLPALAFGAHRVDVVARYKGGATLKRAIAFDYVSPLGRVPTYGADVVPIFAARCGRCHANGVARDLTTYAQLSSQAAAVRASVRESRMPPDILLDATSVAIITAWVDGGAKH
jgi:hypothetical protein